ncbi:dnaJ homolog subfamily C member 4 isoform X2 [Clupea harengus]|uniref:DnaJ homolog subfamily C member 4 isoform X2 n=1 Tax=Clupea harengus TaxID=7950 RepID=A0A8M1KRR5_CLUHA|nr:dnaJ homolog subfamily C member 4 isoform X2 [Clupea harengus]
MQLEAQLRLCHNCIWYYKSAKLLFSHSAIHRSTANYYDLLGLKPDASSDQIKTAFFDKSKKLHPDSDPSNPSLHGQFVELNEAYRVLSRDGSRKEYDLRLRHPYTGSQPFRPTSTHVYRPSAEQAERVRYWEQFSYRQTTGNEQWEQKKKRNMRLVSYCVLLMTLSMGAHFVGFRVNGFKKQTLILRQKHAEFLEKYNMGKDKDDK